MANKYREKMSRLNRAKQFAPFDALSGLSIALAEVRRRHNAVEKTEMGEEELKELNETFMKLKKHDLIKCVFYEDGEYLERSGELTGIYIEIRTIEIDRMKISMDDILELYILEEV